MSLSSSYYSRPFSHRSIFDRTENQFCSHASAFCIIIVIISPTTSGTRYQVLVLFRYTRGVAQTRARDQLFGYVTSCRTLRRTHVAGMNFKISNF